MSTDPIPPFIDIRNIDLYRNGNPILRDFALTIPQGCRYALLGPNGCGKTSLIMLLIKALYPAFKKGSDIRILGRSRWRVRDLQKRMGIISYELQKDYPQHATGREVVISGYFQSQGIYPHQGVDSQMKEEARAIMTRLGIAHLWEKSYSDMSAGEQRRCLLARAWVHHPDYLILDEPTHGIDLPSTWQYLNTLRDWVGRGRGLLLVTHHLSEIIPEVDTVILMKEGRVFSQGAKEEMLTEERLSELYAIPLKVFTREGYYFAMAKV